MNDISGGSRNIKLNRDDASEANDLATRRGHAKRKRHDAATVSALMNGQDAHQGSEHGAWSAAANTLLEIHCARRLPARFPPNVRKQPPNSTVERHEIEGEYGGPHQRSANPTPGPPSRPRTTNHSIPNACEP